MQEQNKYLAIIGANLVLAGAADILNTVLDLSLKLDLTERKIFYW